MANGDISNIDDFLLIDRPFTCGDLVQYSDVAIDTKLGGIKNK